MIPDHTTIQVRSSGYGQAGIGRSSWKGLTRDATRRLRFIVHAAGWLHSMVLHRRHWWCNLILDSLQKSQCTLRICTDEKSEIFESLSSCDGSQCWHIYIYSSFH